MDNSDIVWKKCNDNNKNNYHLYQYDEEYESVKFIKEHIIELDCNNILDLGCGAGSLCYHLHTLDENIHYTGIDINDELILIANKKNPMNSSFYVKSYTEMKNANYDIVISNQCLLIVSPEFQEG